MGTTQRLRGHQTISGRLTVVRSAAGSGSAKCVDLIVRPLAQTALSDDVQKYCGFRQGALNVQMLRASGQAFAATWDGNADEAVKIISRNYGNGLDGVTRIGAVRGLNVQARNSGTNISWVKTVEVNCRNDSGKNTSELHGLHIRAENYGNVYTDVRCLDLEMSDENTTQGQERVALICRSTDLSGMGAVDAVLKISHTSTNGWDYLIHFNGATGDTAVANTHSIDSHALAFIAKCKLNETDGYLPFFAAVPS